MQVYCINQLSPNYDEGSFASYGSTILKFHREKDVALYESKLPITALNMIPRAVEQIVHPGLTKKWPESQSDIIYGRYISLAVAVLLGLLIFSWSKKFYNEKTAFFILLTYLICPNFLAHGIFVSSDIFACFFLTAAFYCLWLFFREGRFKHFFLICMATGFAEISKFSMVHLFLLIPALFGIQLLKRESTANFNLKKVIGYTVLFFGINWLIICTAHLFYQVFEPISSYEFSSNGFKTIQLFVSKISPHFPVPLPSSYIKSMDAVMYFDHLGGGVKGSLNGAPYILGQSSIKGFWYYYLMAIYYKLPISVLILWLGSILIFCFRFSRRTFFENDVFLIVPGVYFLIYMSFFYSTQVGIRHLLIIFPLIFVFSGKFISQFIFGRKQLFLYLLIAYQVISVFNYFPHFLPYTNEFISDKKLAYKKNCGYKYLLWGG